MESPQVTEIWMNTTGCRMELRVDFDNDRHHAILIEAPLDQIAVARALERLAENIRRDSSLVPNAEVSRGAQAQAKTNDA